jgi:hypothetical protein
MKWMSFTNSGKEGRLIAKLFNDTKLKISSGHIIK